MFWCFSLNKNYGLEFDIFRWLGGFHGSITIFDFNCDLCYQRKFDHCPKFQVLFVILNLKIFEFNIYNKHHIDGNE
jgi:hypothetical protein